MSSSDTMELSRTLRQQAVQLGFALVGIAPAVSPPGYDRFRHWLDAGYAADMQWMERRRDAYQSPAGVMPGTVSVIMAAMNYHEGSAHGSHGRVSRYAWGRADYHDVLKDRLQQLAAVLRAARPAARTRVVVDTAPLLERDFARLAGLGWFGRNTMLISRRIGSWFFLGALLTDQPLEYDQPTQTDHCGTCTRCLEACPTQAFPEPGVLDAGRCISYLTIERRHAAIPHELRPAVGDWLFGCDICQEVCPWNRFAPGSAAADFLPLPELREVDCRELLRLTEADFQARFARSPLARPGRAGLLRNAATVLGNLRCLAALPELQQALSDTEPLIRGAAAWALGQLQTPAAESALQARLPCETNAEVQAELQAALRQLTSGSASAAGPHNTWDPGTVDRGTATPASMSTNAGPGLSDSPPPA